VPQSFSRRCETLPTAGIVDLAQPADGMVSSAKRQRGSHHASQLDLREVDYANEQHEVAHPASLWILDVPAQSRGRSRAVGRWIRGRANRGFACTTSVQKTTPEPSQVSLKLSQPGGITPPPYV
jgi:hypothetical protein